MQGYVGALETLDSRQFAMLVRGLANALLYGVERSPFVGSGVEYVQSRVYQDGDPIRSIDWRVTARTGRTHVKEYETPKSMPTYFLVDTSASMVVSSTARSKYHVALFAAGGLALASLDRISPVGLVTVGDRALRFEPSLSQSRVLEWLHQLRTYHFDEGTHLAARIGELGPRLGQRSLVIVLSDLHDPGALGALRRLAQLHDVVVLELRDPAEEGNPGAGFLRAREAETGRLTLLRAAQAHVRSQGAALELRRAKVDHLLIRTDRPFVQDLRRLFKARGILGRGTR